MLVNKEILLVLNVILNTVKQQITKTTDIYVCMYTGIHIHVLYIFRRMGTEQRPKMKGNKIYAQLESRKHSYLLHYFLSVSWFRNSVWFSFFCIFFCFVFSFVLLMCVCVCVCVLCSRFVELIENSHFAFSCWMREKFLTIDAISFLCSHFKPKAKVWWKWATERLAHERERGPWKKKTKTEQFFPSVFFPRCPDLL